MPDLVVRQSFTPNRFRGLTAHMGLTAGLHIRWFAEPFGRGYVGGQKTLAPQACEVVWGETWRTFRIDVPRQWV
jgi:hypothetical protein